MIRVNDIIEGYVVMRCTKEQIIPERMKAMEIIQNILSLFFKDNDTANTMHYTYQKVFIEELLNNRIHTSKQLGLWFDNIGNAYQSPYRIAAISTDNKQDKNVLSYIRKTIQQFFPYHFELIQQNILYILEYNLTVNDCVAKKQFDVLLSKFNAHCGISNAYDNLLETSDYRIQAEDALSLGGRIPCDSRIYRYENYYLPAILAPRMEQMPLCNLSTLYTYVKYLGNTSETAGQLHIHRNTLLYRIKKIEDITGSSIRDYETFIHLAISFYMIDYARKT